MKSAMNYLQFMLLLLLVFSIMNLEKSTKGKISHRNNDKPQTTDFCISFGTKLFADKKPISKCIPERWRSPNNIISNNNEFVCLAGAVKKIADELKNYLKFFTKKLNYECHGGRKVKEDLIKKVIRKIEADKKKSEKLTKLKANAKQSQLGVKNSTNRIKTAPDKSSAPVKEEDTTKAPAQASTQGPTKDSVNKKQSQGKFIQVSMKTKSMANSLPAPPAPKTDLPTDKKLDSSDGKGLKFFENNLSNFGRNVLGFFFLPCFKSFMEMLTCIQEKEDQSEKLPFSDFVVKFKEKIKNLYKTRPTSEVVMGVDILCNWGELKKVVEDLNKGINNNKDPKSQWELIALGLAGLFKIISI